MSHIVRVTASGAALANAGLFAWLVKVIRESSRLQLAEHAVFLSVLWTFASKVYKLGLKKSIGAVVRMFLGAVPGASSALDSQLDSEVRTAVADMMKGAPAAIDSPVPKAGVSKEDILKELEEVRAIDVKPSDGLTFAYVYTPSERSTHEVAHTAAAMFCDLNALNPTAFPSLRKMEVEVIAMCRHMTGGVDGVTGTMTSGGTESILMGVKTARDHARAVRGISDPECVLPMTAHPAFAKAGHYLGVKMIWIPVHPKTQAADVDAMAAALTSRTCLIVGSATQYPHGILDPISRLAALAASRGVLMHVDACFGGFVMPWLRAAGFEHPDWDFRVPGVTSISMDVHKYGFCVKGASCIMYRSKDLRIRQYFAYSEWPGGLFVSPSMLGTRSGGPIASAWATMKHMGSDGYIKTVREMMDTVAFLKNAVGKMDGVEIIGNPVATAIAIRASNPGSLNIYAVADVMEAEGHWKLERNKDPASLHLTVMPPHTKTRNKFISDMESAIAKVSADPAKYSKVGSAAMYGMIATIPDETIIDKFVAKWMDQVYSPALPSP
eukprot:m.445832 g.445832  ORF g.445832 m.445832 type:complete len:553 (-) comp19282_c0_seq1:23-1681(-)